MTRRFEGKVVLVTGAGGGIGSATAKRFAQDGATLVLVGLQAEALAPLVAEVLHEGAPQAWACTCDVSVESEVSAAVAGTLQRFGRLDVIVNNAGLMSFKKLEEFTGDDWRRILGVDLLGAFYFIKQGFLHMPSGSSIVNVSSVHAERTTPMVAPYAAAKAAVLSLTRSAAIEGRKKGIRTNAILPGAVETPMLRDNPEVKAGVEHIDPGELGKPDQIAAVIAWLASEDASFVQGAALAADGGRLSEL